MEKFRIPTDSQIKERAKKGHYLNSARYTLKGLEIISEQLDQLSKKFDQALSLVDMEGKQKIGK